MASKLQQGVTINRILDDIRDSVDQNMKREHLITQQDVTNIQRQYNIQGIQHHPNDHSSIQAWVEELQAQKYNSVLLFKQGQQQDEDMDNIGKNDFILGIQTEFQRDMMCHFGSNVICIDATHGTNIYDFYLVSLMTVDDYGEGVPEAWAITNKEDGCMLTEFFMSIKKRTGDIKPNVVMTDDAEQHWNAWIHTFGRNNTKKLLCRWHIDRAWRNALSEHVTNKADQISVYHFLQVLMTEKDKSQFTIRLQQFLSHTKDKHPTFYDYFINNYSNRTAQWATCDRKWSFVNTNMFTESFHNILKNVYLDNKQNRRVDHLVSILLKIARDKAFERFQKLHKGKPTHRVTEINKRHRTAETLQTTVQNIQEGVWTVQSQREIGKEYTVQHIGDCSSCKIRCS